MNFKRIFLFLGCFALVSSLQTASAKIIESTNAIPVEILNMHIAQCPEFKRDGADMMIMEVYELPKLEYSSTTSEFYLLGCNNYAYNFMGKGYIYSPIYKTVTLVSVADIAGDGSISATSDLMGFEYVPATLTLSTFQKGRGMGDCGSASSYLYNPNLEKFTLLEARVKDQCDGKNTEWPVVYKK